MKSDLIKKITSKRFKLAVIGLGYVGLPLAVEFAKRGYSVLGIDVDNKKITQLCSKKSYIQDVSSRDIIEIVNRGRFKATTDFTQLKNQDGVIICVPTPLSKTREPDISFIIDATEKIANFLHRKQIIVLESTTFPGTTEEIVLPILEKKGFKVGRDFYLGFSPERVDPANKLFSTTNIPKVIGGVTTVCTKMIKQLYSQVIGVVVPVSSAKVAEMVKLLENTFRAVNIALINEICLMASRLNVDVWEVIRAAGTKPFGFMTFKPGPGLGGHCLPIDPLYLSWKARLHGFESRFIQLADEINSSMPAYVVDRITQGLNVYSKSLKDSKILIIGVSYKPGVSDIRESPAIEIIRQLREKKAKVSFHDPMVKSIRIDNTSLRSMSLNKSSIKNKDCVVIVTPHRSIDYGLIRKNAQLIFDTRNVFNGKKGERIITL
ncbi:MAG: nucleotide sugar dehydrogenase [Candidatus Omnitrophica bacterium]|nr:nucleotide sugar dehydrogenase [Candidatus Omnitrophota bacterium]